MTHTPEPENQPDLLPAPSDKVEALEFLNDLMAEAVSTSGNDDPEAFKWRARKPLETIRAALSTPRRAADLEGLKREVRQTSDGTFTPCDDPYDRGWNDCIDHLAASGYLKTPQQAGSVPDGWKKIDEAAKNQTKGAWFKFPDGRIEWGKWGYSANAEVEAYGTYPLDEFGQRIPCFLPFALQPLEYFIERRAKPSAAPQPAQDEKGGV